MWGKHDETRAFLKTALAVFTDEKLQVGAAFHAIRLESLEPAVKAVEDMIIKEEEILLPMSIPH
jgi:DUF438 domain-containing protein